MMKIVVLTGSPHHPGSSEKLADAFIKGAREAGNEVYRFDAGRRTSEFSLIQLEDNHPGQEVAIEPADVVTNEVMPKLLAADMVVLVSSLYYYGMNAALKAVIDRFYHWNHELHGDKKAITLVSGYGQEDAFASLKLYFEQLFRYIRWERVGGVLAADAWNEEKLAKHIDEAYQLGKQVK
jgi:multimeric flavodoxin WrbA